ncbi:hypothetical protein M758_7G118400 [Ceratodon purpureus]|nr:hypothetical protein M758_7G118400 [Ceratodon purpureus]
MELYFSSQCENLQLAPQLDGHLDPVSPSLSLSASSSSASLSHLLSPLLHIPFQSPAAGIVLQFLDAHLSSLISQDQDQAAAHSITVSIISISREYQLRHGDITCLAVKINIFLAWMVYILILFLVIGDRCVLCATSSVPWFDASFDALIDPLLY